MPACVKAVETSSLTRIYNRGVVGIADLDMTVDPGEVVGLVGPNGSGKTTTIRLLLDFLRPTSGRASVLGLDSRRDSLAIRKQIGFLPGDLTFHESLTGAETLRLYEQLRPGTPPIRRAELLENLALSDEVLSRRVGTYSTGMRRKLGLVVALQHDPTLAILDEPTNGLDPLMRRRCHETIRRWRGESRTLFLSTHDILEVDRLCHRVFVVRAGRLVAARSVEDFRGGGDANDLEESILRYYEGAE
jgi:ABC-2 type transport system ATP-binding protein